MEILPGQGQVFVEDAPPVDAGTTIPPPVTVEPEKPKTVSTMLRAGTKLPDGMALQRDTMVEYAFLGGRKIVVGPSGVRPRLLIGMALSALATFILAASPVAADESPKPPTEIEVCRADAAQMRAALEQLAKVMARLGVEAQGVVDQSKARGQ